VFHFHTRTKTGRVAELQKASPEPRLTLNKNDAEKFDIHNDDLVLIESVRGQIEIQATIGEIAEGQVFIPFHYGYWDATDGRARAANELTQSKHRCSIVPYLKLIVR
jgi:ferredoxin-nitrate reductase